MTFHFEVTKCMYYYNLTFKLNIHGHILGKCTYLKRTYRHYIYIFIFRQKGLHEKLPSCMEKRTNLVHIINTLNMLWFHKFIVEYQFSWNLLVSWFSKPAFIEVLYIVTHCYKKNSHECLCTWSFQRKSTSTTSEYLWRHVRVYNQRSTTEHRVQLHSILEYI